MLRAVMTTGGDRSLGGVCREQWWVDRAMDSLGSDHSSTPACMGFHLVLAWSAPSSSSAHPPRKPFLLHDHCTPGLGERGISAEAVGRRAGAELAALLASGACVDAHAADQLVIFAAMAGGESRILMGEPTLHTLAAIAVAEQLTAARFDLQTVEGLTLMACHGAGLTWG